MNNFSTPAYSIILTATRGQPMIHYQHTTENLSRENSPLSIRRLGTAQRL
jgi:hypothetical protein